jgi:membrane fusion protein, multidrug efflux system
LRGSILKKSGIKILAVIFILTIVNCSGEKSENNQNGNEQNIIPVKVMTLEPDNFTEIGEYYGRVSGINEAALICISGGTVERINVKEGDFVTKGTSLGKIESDSAIANYEMAQLNERIAFEDYERNQQFLQSGNASRVEVDRSNLTYLQSKSALIQAKENYDSALCIAPIDGIVVSRHIDLYQELPPGSPSFTIAQLDKLKITIGIPEKEMSGVEEGNKAVVHVDMFPDQEFEGELVRLSREISTRTLKFEAEIQIDNPDMQIMSGVTALVILERRKLQDQIIIPTAAILIEGNTRYVMTANRDRAKQVFIEVGPSNKTHTVILSGLVPGDKLIIEGNALVKNNSEIKIIE